MGALILDDYAVRELRKACENLILLLTAVSDGGLLGSMSAVNTPGLVGSVPIPEEVTAKPATIAQAVALWDEEHRHKREDRYRFQVVKLIEDLARLSGSQSLDQITRAHVVSASNHWQSEAGGGNSGKTIVNKLTAIRAFFDWAIRIELARVNPAKDIEAPRVYKRKQRALTAAEVVAMIETTRAAGKPTRALMYRVLAVSGLRIGELLELRGEHFRVWTDAPHIYVPPEVAEKGHREKTVALDEETAGMLRAHLDGKGKSERAFGRVKHDTLKRDMRVAGIADKDERGRTVAWHGFRRFVPTELQRAGVSAAVAQQQLGHTRIETTLQHYTDSSLAELHRAAGVLSDALRSYPQSTEKSAVSLDKGKWIADIHGDASSMNTNISNTGLSVPRSRPGDASHHHESRGPAVLNRADQFGRGLQESNAPAEERFDLQNTGVRSRTCLPLQDRDIPVRAAHLLGVALDCLKTVIGLVGQGADRGTSSSLAQGSGGQVREG